MRYTFKAYERLKRQQHIETLFHTGKAFSAFPVKAIYLVLPRGAEEQAPVRIGVSVPKKNFRKSVHRQRLKRLLREAWRLHKHELYAVVPAGSQLHIFFIYTNKELLPFATVETAILKIIETLSRKLNPEQASPNFAP